MSVTANIRMYNQKNLGDCFLLKFTDAENKAAYYLIDFGSYTTGKDVQKREKEIACDIKETIGDSKLTIVLTHQHKDHLSGFESAGDLLKGNERELWLSYLDSESSKEGQRIRAVTEKYWKKNVKIKTLLRDKYAGVPAVESMLKQKEGYDLFAEEQIGGKAMTKLINIVNKNIRYLTPGESFALPGICEGVNVYVLGPPYDNALLTKMDPAKSEAVQGLNAMLEMANLDVSATLMLDALESISDMPGKMCREQDFPFSRNFIDNTNSCTKEQYYATEYRQIDHEWLSEIGRLALHMDKFTNNTSLVLAFEMVESKKVLLFVGDAQIGNWESWFKVKFADPAVTGESLLSRTVLYKAGHHSSFNATLKQGLDLMNENELIIIIPVDESVSTKFRFAMLKPGMLEGYRRKSQGRVLRSDTIVHDGHAPVTKYPFITRDNLPNLIITPDSTGKNHLSIELEIKG